jgi:aminoglycoside/choline kinase family phosphotransferase
MPISPDLQLEFVHLAEQCENYNGAFFLHRDFQSRNIMLNGDKFGIIDFQGGRLGPLAYDVSSLLMDPYIMLPPEIQNELFAYYWSLIADKSALDFHTFRTEYEHIALQRNLQIIAAFSFLSRVKGKLFFQQYLKPSVAMLKMRLAQEYLQDYQELRRYAKKALSLL